MAENPNVSYQVDSNVRALSTENQGVLSNNVDVSAQRKKPDRTGYINMRGKLASGTHGGHLTPLGCFEYLAGAKIASIQMKGIAKLQPIKHVSFEKLQLKCYAVFVPNSRVWVDADKFAAQRHAPLQGEKVTNVPMGNLSRTRTSLVQLGNLAVPLFNTTLYRESIAYHYYGRSAFLNVNVLPCRGYIASLNDIFIDKRSQKVYKEFNETIVSEAEHQALFQLRGQGTPSGGILPEDVENPIDVCSFIQRTSANKNYWNDYRTDVFSNNSPVNNDSLNAHNITQQMIDEYRTQAENVNKTDAEVIAELRGIYQAKENECQIIAKKTIDIDLSVQPQTSENDRLTLGEDGALSYSFIDLEMDMSKEFIHPKDGYVHYFYKLTMQDNTVYASSGNVEFIKSEWNEFYRPSMENLKDDALRLGEVHQLQDNGEAQIIGFKRRYSEYFRHPIFIRGDFIGDERLYGSPPSNRVNSNGFISLSLDGTSRVGLPSTLDWTGLACLSEKSNLSQSGVDGTDATLRRLMLVDGGNLSTTLYRRRTNQAMYLLLDVNVVISQPINSKIASQFIGWGDE